MKVEAWRRIQENVSRLHIPAIREKTKGRAKESIVVAISRSLKELRERMLSKEAIPSGG